MLVALTLNVGVGVGLGLPLVTAAVVGLLAAHAAMGFYELTRAPSARRGRGASTTAPAGAAHAPRDHQRSGAGIDPPP